MAFVVACNHSACVYLSGILVEHTLTYAFSLILAGMLNSNFACMIKFWAVVCKKVWLAEKKLHVLLQVTLLQLPRLQQLHLAMAVVFSTGEAGVATAAAGEAGAATMVATMVVVALQLLLPALLLLVMTCPPLTSQPDMYANKCIPYQ